MPEPTVFGDLLSSLTRLESFSPITHDNDKTGHSRLAVSLTLHDGEPFVTFLSPDVNPATLSGAARRLYNEIQRVGRMTNAFSISWDNREALGVSLWENTQLIQLLPGADSILMPDSEQAHFDDSVTSLVLHIEGPDSKGLLTPRLVARYGDTETENLFFLSDSCVAPGNVILDTQPVGPNFRHIREMLGKIPRDMLDTYLSLFLSYFDGIVPEYRGLAAKFAKTPEEAVPTIVLEKVAPDQALYLRVSATIGSLGEDFASRIAVTRVASADDNGQIVVRDVAHTDISEDADMLESLIAQSAPTRQARKEIYRDGNFFIIPAETASPFLVNHLAEILQKFRLVGSEKLKEYKVTAAKPRLNLKMASGIDFLEGSAEVTVGNDTFSIADLLSQFHRNRYIKLSDGNRAIIDERYMNRLQRLFNRRDKEGNVKVSLFDLPEIEDLIQDKIKGKAATRTREVFEGFNRLRDMTAPNYPVNATLREYQKEGVKWIGYLYENRLGGCLADDMGLGKTLQTISMLSTLYPGTELPTLVVMPRSLLFNWEKEFEKFAPQISVSTYYGPDRNLDESLKSNVVITTYAVVRNDIDRLRNIRFQYVILDESQNIKTVSSQTAQAVTLLDSEHRLALSGTPMENNLTEIYSLFRFLNPTMFGTLDEFNASYTYPIQKNGDKDATESLRRKIFPFILRRLKRDVLTELPDRIDRTLYVEMSDRQRRFYEDRRIAYRNEINSTIAKSGIAKSQFVMFQALNELRRIASVPESLTDGAIHSPKIDELLENLAEAVGNGHKTVVFFNYIAGLDIVASRLQSLGIEFESMTGSTTAASRKKIVERFQSDPKCMVLLMTLKVGGVGLNLTAADTVFIFEPWWNKAAEEQAINRLHRIGQKASVVSCSIITEGTIEEKILQLQQQKKELFDNLISDDTASTKHLSEEDINFILS